MKELLSDESGRLSSVRVMSFIALAMTVACTIAQICGVDIPYEVFVTWITAAFAPKVIQKFAESKIKKGE